MCILASETYPGERFSSTSPLGCRVKKSISDNDHTALPVQRATGPHVHTYHDSFLLPHLKTKKIRYCI